MMYALNASRERERERERERDELHEKRTTRDATAAACVLGDAVTRLAQLSRSFHLLIPCSHSCCLCLTYCLQRRNVSITARIQPDVTKRTTVQTTRQTVDVRGIGVKPLFASLCMTCVC